MGYRMVCLDIDGTLLDSQHRLSETTICRVQQVRDRGVEVVLVSARMPAAIEPVQKALGLGGPIICYNGALVSKVGRSLLVDEPIESTAAVRLYQLAERQSLHVSFYHYDCWYVENLDRWAEAERRIVGVAPRTQKLSGLLERWRATRVGPHKVLLIGPSEVVAPVGRRAATLEGVQACLSKPGYLEVVSQKASKLGAVQRLCCLRRISLKEVLAIGDGENDCQMLLGVGLGIAMGNAPRSVKERAAAVTADNDHDGVAIALEEYVLGNSR